MTYLERLKKLNMHQGTTDKTDKSTSVSFVSPPQAQMDEHAEAVARQTRVIEWLNANPAPSAPDRCAGCGGADAPGSAPNNVSRSPSRAPISFSRKRAGRKQRRV